MSIFAEKSQTEFFRAITISGLDAGLGAKCPVCSGCVRYGLFSDSTFEHCGRKESVPTDWHKLPARSLRRGMPELPKGFITLDTWDDIGGWDEENAQKSDDASAYEVGWV